MQKAEMLKRHILFQAEDKDTYIKTMLEAVVSDAKSDAGDDGRL
jgi:hypothetical protein